ncbi:MAG TPA: acyl-CoA dehydrogenase family protein [Acidimicrobiales bacterium]|nr:acyl-CoA dehydrogenase family protein [Acidimicrobiales bacterium]
MDLVADAEALADEVLFPAALATDAADAVPSGNLDALASLGLYGIFAPPEVGGLGADFPSMARTVEAIAGGCLTTALVWIQHFGLLGSVLGGPDHLRDAWLPDICRGDRRGGIAFGGLLPGTPVLTATPVDDDGWRLDGFAPWVSGWTRIDVLHVAARGAAGDTVVNLAIDAVEQPGLSITRQRLAALDASVTVRAGFDGLVVPAERLLGTTPYDPEASLGASLRLNGSLALGVARRCCALLGGSPFDDELAERRAAIDAADADEMAAERARTSELAFRAAGALVVHAGSRAVRSDDHAQRLLREAMFLLVFGSRPMIKDELAPLLRRR